MMIKWVNLRNVFFTAAPGTLQWVAILIVFVYKAVDNKGCTEPGDQGFLGMGHASFLPPITWL